MARLLQVVMVLVISALLASCAGVPATADYDPQYNFRAIGSYAWLPPSNEPGTDPLLYNDLVDARVRNAVDAQLAARGWRKVDANNAEVLVSYHLGIAEKVSITDFHSHFGYYPCFHCAGYWPYHYPFHGPFYDSDLWVRQYKEGTLVIDMINPKDKRLVWRGASARTLPRMQTPEERRLFIVETVDAILAQFPPGMVQQ